MTWNTAWTDTKHQAAQDMFRAAVVQGVGCEWGPVRLVQAPEGVFQVYLSGNVTLATTDPEEALQRWMLYVEREEGCYILCAAVYIDDGKHHARSYAYPSTGLVFSGWRHPDCFALFYEWVDRLTEDEKAEIEAISEGQIHARRQGFLTSTGRYVDREEGWAIAVRAGQVQPLAGEGHTLCSEDLY